MDAISFLVVYESGEGQTGKVAERVVGVLSDRGHETTLFGVEVLPPNLDVEEFDAVLVGSSIHLGRHGGAIRSFVENNREAFAGRPTGFFQLSLSSAVDDEDRQAEAAGYVDAFLEGTGWDPDRIALFGGALRYSEYGFLKRLLMQRIAEGATGDTDTARDYEYTDWAEVAAFANDFASFVEGRLGVVPPDAGDAPE